MSIHTQMSKEAEAYLGETPLSVRRSLLDAIEIYRNHDTIMQEKAIDAIAEGRASYWTTSSYSNAVMSNLPYSLNAGVEINEAIEAAHPEWRYARNPALRKEHCRFALDTIVPLNRKAALALSVAYSQKGAWRDEDELLIRAKRDTRPRAA